MYGIGSVLVELVVIFEILEILDSKRSARKYFQSLAIL